MVSPSYVLEKPSGTSVLKRRLDQEVIPAALNAVAPIEGALYRMSERVRARPAATLLAATAAGYLLSLLRPARRRASWR